MALISERKTRIALQQRGNAFKKLIEVNMNSSKGFMIFAKINLPQMISIMMAPQQAQ